MAAELGGVPVGTFVGRDPGGLRPEGGDVDRRTPLRPGVQVVAKFGWPAVDTRWMVGCLSFSLP